jgi:hypothetical protein
MQNILIVCEMDNGNGVFFIETIYGELIAGGTWKLKH